MTRTIVFAIVVLFCLVSVGTAYYRETDYLTYTQPDGKTAFEMKSRIMDDLWRYETKDGYRIMRASDGWWYYCTLDENGDYTPTKDTVGINTAPGNSYQLERDSVFFALREQRLLEQDSILAPAQLDQIVPNPPTIAPIQVNVYFVKFLNEAASRFQEHADSNGWTYDTTRWNRMLKDATYGSTTDLDGYPVYGNLRQYLNWTGATLDPYFDIRYRFPNGGWWWTLNAPDSIFPSNGLQQFIDSVNAVVSPTLSSRPLGQINLVIFSGTLQDTLLPIHAPVYQYYSNSASLVILPEVWTAENDPTQQTLLTVGPIARYLLNGCGLSYRRWIALDGNLNPVNEHERVIDSKYFGLMGKGDEQGVHIDNSPVHIGNAPARLEAFPRYQLGWRTNITSLYRDADEHTISVSVPGTGATNATILFSNNRKGDSTRVSFEPVDRTTIGNTQLPFAAAATQLMVLYYSVDEYYATVMKRHHFNQYLVANPNAEENIVTLFPGNGGQTSTEIPFVSSPQLNRIDTLYNFTSTRIPVFSSRSMSFYLSPGNASGWNVSNIVANGGLISLRCLTNAWSGDVHLGATSYSGSPTLEIKGQGSSGHILGLTILSGHVKLSNFSCDNSSMIQLIDNSSDLNSQGRYWPRIEFNDSIAGVFNVIGRLPATFYTQRMKDKSYVDLDGMSLSQNSSIQIQNVHYISLKHLNVIEGTVNIIGRTQLDGFLYRDTSWFHCNLINYDLEDPYGITSWYQDSLVIRNGGALSLNSLRINTHPRLPNPHPIRITASQNILDSIPSLYLKKLQMWGVPDRMYDHPSSPDYNHGKLKINLQNTTMLIDTAIVRRPDSALFYPPVRYNLDITSIHSNIHIKPFTMDQADSNCIVLTTDSSYVDSKYSGPERLYFSNTTAILQSYSGQYGQYIKQIPSDSLVLLGNNSAIDLRANIKGRVQLTNSVLTANNVRFSLLSNQSPPSGAAIIKSTGGIVTLDSCVFDSIAGIASQYICVNSTYDNDVEITFCTFHASNSTSSAIWVSHPQENMAIIASDFTGFGNAISLSQSTNWHLTDNKIRSCQFGITLEECVSNDVVGCRVDRCAVGISTTLSNPWLAQDTILNCNTGIYLKDSTPWMTNVYIDGNSSYAVLQTYTAQIDASNGECRNQFSNSGIAEIMTNNLIYPLLWQGHNDFENIEEEVPFIYANPELQGDPQNVELGGNFWVTPITPENFDARFPRPGFVSVGIEQPDENENVPNILANPLDNEDLQYLTAVRLERMGQLAIAASSYRSYLTQYPDSNNAQVVANRLYLLEKARSSDLRALRSEFDTISAYSNPRLSGVARLSAFRCSRDLHDFTDAITRLIILYSHATNHNDSINLQIEELLLAREIEVSDTIRSKSGYFGGSSSQKLVTMSRPNSINDYQDRMRSLVLELMGFAISSPQPISTQNVHIPLSYCLRSVYPNPFNSALRVRFEVPRNERVSISVHDALGRIVETLRDEQMTVGRHEISWNASRFASGVYFVSMKAPGFVATKKAVLLK